MRGALSLRDAGELAGRLRTAIEAHPAVTITADELTELDVSILQVLVSAHKTAAQAGKSLTLKAPPDGALRRTLVRAGFVGADGAPRTPEGHFWTPPSGHAKGRAA
ncbi:MAG: STAS domain-containing protein [Devosia sp.]|nr:STAS domain-containing protein [Devosia sp.]